MQKCQSKVCTRNEVKRANASLVPGLTPTTLRRIRKTRKEASSSLNQRPELPDTDIETITVLSAEELEPLSDIEEKLAFIAEQVNREMKGSDEETWLATFKLIEDIRRVTIKHKGAFKRANLELNKIISLIIIGISSLRSAQTRNSILAVKELFVHLNSAEISVIDDALMKNLIKCLLIKGTNDKKFIAVSAQEAMKNIAKFCPILKVVSSLMDYSRNKNTKIIAISACSVLLAVKSASNEEIEPVEKDIIKAAVEYMRGQSVEAKEHGRQILRMLSSKRNVKESFLKACEEILDKQTVQEVTTIISKGNTTTTSSNKRSDLKKLMMAKRKALQKSNGENNNPNILVV